MKAICILVVTALYIMACKKSNNSNDTIAPDDLTASAAMTSRLTDMQTALNSLIAAPTLSQRKYWDSAYHHHDSLFWHHHNIYHHSTYTHDDHGHQWIPYDPTINHHNHHHHHYPGHLNDSLVTSTNNHHHTTCHHHPGHHICHHHTMDSLHHVHNSHHP